MHLEELLNQPNIGPFSHCEITLIVLNDKKNKQYGIYFAHIDFKQSLVAETTSEWLTKVPISINDRIKVMVSKQILSVKNFLNIYNHIIESQEWKNGSDIGFTDNVFPVEAKFVPESDPTGYVTSESVLVPLEQAFYGSNYCGNYYVCELFSRKDIFNSLLNSDDILSIQQELKLLKVPFDLSRLTDRIGNIVCKIPVTAVKHKPLLLAPENGIKGTFSKQCPSEDRIFCTLQILTEIDNMLVSNSTKSFVLSNESNYEYELEPNPYKNTIILSDTNSGIIYYMAVRDYRFASDYYHTVTPPNYLVQVPKSRTVTVNGSAITIPLTSIEGVGTISISKDAYEISLRQQVWKDNYSYNRNYFRAFNGNDRESALEAIKSILNDSDLFWDLKEIWLIDPYLSPSDILNTAVYCEKSGICIKCLTSINTINGNVITKVENTDCTISAFENTKKKYHSDLEAAIPNDTDFKIEYRTVYGNFGKTFHDRYLILKYGINRCRAWSVGISFNQIGESHHIIQIVESPSDVERIIDDIWNETDNEQCLIYKNY